MKSMLKLASRLLIMFGLIVGTELAIVLLPAKPYVYYSAVIEKHQRLKALASPKIVFIGGSNLALSLDSQVIEQQTGFPVVNMGLHIGIGLRYMMDEIKADIKSGDIIVVSPEYQHWYGTYFDGGPITLWAIYARPESLTSISSLQQFTVLLKSVPEFTGQKLKEFTSNKHDPIYNRESFDKYGDLVSHLDKPSIPHLSGGERLLEMSYNSETAYALKDFAAFTNAQGAKLIYLFPPWSASQFAFSDNQLALAQITSELSQIPGLLVIGTPKDSVFDDSQFFDTEYHLSAQSRQTHTLQVSSELNQVIQANNP